MTIEADLVAVLSPLVAGRVYADFSPEAILPRIVFQQVGGTPLQFVEGVAGMRNGRFQISVLAASKTQSVDLVRKVEDLLIGQLRAQVMGGPVSAYDDATKVFVHMQDFGVWF